MLNKNDKASKVVITHYNDNLPEDVQIEMPSIDC